jgi:Tfp pilus assembly protein PilX
MKPTNNRKKNLHSSRGVALVITLLMLLLFTAMTLAMVIATTSDTLINGYYRNYRGSFYAADSGANAARAYLTTLIQSNVTSSPYVLYQPPIPIGTDASIRSQLITAFGSNNSILGSQTASWPASFTLDPTVVNGNTYGNTTLTQQCVNPVQYSLTFATSGVVGTTPPTCTSPGNPPAAYNITGYTYYYYYSIGVIGQAFNGQQNKIAETGYFNFFVPVKTTAGTTTSFSGWGTLYDKFALCSAPWVPGTMTGAIFSNDSLNFGDPGQTGTSTKYVFTGTVGIADAQAGYFHTAGRGSDCQPSAASSNSADGTTIAPTFTGGWLTGQPTIPLPQDSFNQERAVLNGNGACMVTPCPPVAQSEMGVLQDVNHNLWPTTGSPSSGVYLPYSTTISGGVTTNTFTGGGILVQGDAAQVTLTASTSGSGASKHNLQVIAVKQSGQPTTTVTIDLTGNTTTVTNGTTTTTIQGVPENLGANPPSEACMLYVNGNISSNVGANSPTGLTGPSSGAAIQNGSALTVTATGTIDITGSLIYSTEPVSLNAADTAVSPAPTNVLGIFTPGGNVELKPSTSGQNLEIDASIATVSQGGSGGIQASWNSINQVVIVGGRVQNNALDGSSIQNGRNIWFDQRFAGGGFAPPWFPATTIGSTITYSGTPNAPIATRLSWVNTTAQ